jgi:Flp pilus assembly pilin Flp
MEDTNQQDSNDQFFTDEEGVQAVEEVRITVTIVTVLM